MSADDKTDLDLDALAALEQAATPGPWMGELGDSWYVYDEPTGNMCWNVDPNSPDLGTDAALVAALRNAAPALIAAARDRDALARSAAGTLAGLVIEAGQERDGIFTELDAARAEVAALRERVEAACAWAESQSVAFGHHNPRAAEVAVTVTANVRAALTTGGDE